LAADATKKEPQGNQSLKQWIRLGALYTAEKVKLILINDFIISNQKFTFL
jgi:hypothetical protein